MGICQILEQPEVSEMDKFKPNDKVKFRYEGQVPTYGADGLVREGTGEIIQKKTFLNDIFYIVETGFHAVMIREGEIQLL